MVLSLQPVLAGEEEQISSLFPNHRVKNITIDSGWSLVRLRSSVKEQEPFSGVALCQKIDGTDGHSGVALKAVFIDAKHLIRAAAGQLTRTEAAAVASERHFPWIHKL